MIRRRDFVAGTVAAVLEPAVRAQAADKVPTVGVLFPASREELLLRMESFAKGLRQAGMEPGRDLVLDEHAAEGNYDRMPDIAAALVRNKVSVILAAGGPSASAAAKAATATVPIVFEVGFDPIQLGLVQSFNRPGGNLTGVYLPTADPPVNAKRLQILRELVPSVRLVGVLVNPAAPAIVDSLKAANGPTSAIGLELRFVEVRSEDDLVAAFDRFAADRVGAVLGGTDPTLSAWRDRIATLAAVHRLPVISSLPEDVAHGVLASYGPDFDEALAQAGFLATRILKGANPADLPVIQSSKYILAINLKTAKALGITVPVTLLATADQVIE